MEDNLNYLVRTIFTGLVLVVGCSGSGALGCGDSGSEPAQGVESELLGIYRVDTYQGTAEGDEAPDVCERLEDLEPTPALLVLYSFTSSDSSDAPVLGGAFCSDVEGCRRTAEAASEPPIGYSFRQGNDQSGWLGWGVASTGNMGEQCQANIQAHTLTASEGQMIRINTETFETVYPPSIEGTDATCSIRDAIDSLNPDLPCKVRFLLEATREASL